MTDSPAFPPALEVGNGIPRPRRGLSDLVGEALGLQGSGSQRSGGGIMLSGDELRADTIEAFGRALAACSGLGLVFKVRAGGSPIERTADLDGGAASGSLTREALRTEVGGIEIEIGIVDDRHVRQVMRLGGVPIEVLDATPEGILRRRRPLPDIGSPELRALLDAHAFPLPPAPPPAEVPAPMREVIATAVALGRSLVWKPTGSSFAFGLFRPEEMISPMRKCIIPRATPAEGAPLLVAEAWPFYRWGPLQMAHIGWAAEFTSYYVDEQGCVWSHDPTQDELDQRAGDLVAFLEGFAAGPEDSRDRSSESLFFPMRSPGELPAAFGAVCVPRRSDARMAMWVSDRYTFWESIPSLGVPLVEVRAASNEDLPAVLRWARQRWGTKRMALIWMPAADVLEKAAREEGVEIVDGGPSSWKPASFWEDAG